MLWRWWRELAGTEQPLFGISSVPVGKNASGNAASIRKRVVGLTKRSLLSAGGACLNIVVCANLHMLLPGRWKRVLVKSPSSTVQAESALALRNSAMEHLTAQTTVMRTSTGSIQTFKYLNFQTFKLSSIQTSMKFMFKTCWLINGNSQVYSKDRSASFRSRALWPKLWPSGGERCPWNRTNPKVLAQNFRLCGSIMMPFPNTFINKNNQVRHKGVWGTVCNDNFSEREAKVFCR